MRDSASIHIRQAQIEDLNAMSRLLSELFTLEADFEPNDTLQRQGLHQLLQARPRAEILVATHRSILIGMCTAQLVVSTAKGCFSAWIEDVIIDRHWRSEGIGTRLLHEIENWAHQQGATRLQLLADQQNSPAIDFYEKRNWTQTQLICLRKQE